MSSGGVFCFQRGPQPWWESGVGFLMRHAWIAFGLVIVVCGGDGLRPATAGVTGNPYEWIVERNPFGLRAPVPVDDTPVLPPVPPPPQAVVELTGITSILATPRALLEIVPGPGKPMLKPILGVGERLDLVEVISISMEKGEVVLRNGSVVTNVSLRVAKIGTPAPPPAGNPSGLVAGTIPALERSATSDRRSVALGGGVPIPERVARVPRLPPVPPSPRSAVPPSPTLQ